MLRDPPANGFWANPFFLAGPKKKMILYEILSFGR